MTDESRYTRGIKGMLFGALIVAFGLTPFVFFFPTYFDIRDLVSGLIAGALLGFILKMCLPKGFPIPKDLTTFTCLGASTFSFWVVIDGIMKGEIHGTFRRRGGVTKGVFEMWSWKNDPISFSYFAIAWTLVGAMCVGMPIWYYLKAIQATSPESSLLGQSKLRSFFSEWNKLPEKPRPSLCLRSLSLQS